jgi:hypothetical protein
MVTLSTEIAAEEVFLVAECTAEVTQLLVQKSWVFKHDSNGVLVPATLIIFLP